MDMEGKWFKRTLEQTMKSRQVEGYSSTLSLTLALDGVGGQRHAPGILPPQKRACTHRTRKWVDARTGLHG